MPTARTTAAARLGAHFTDDEDVARVQAVVDELTPKEWEKRPKARPGEDTLPLERWTEMDEDAARPRSEGRLHLPPTPLALPVEAAVRCTQQGCAPVVHHTR